jgi:molybdenum cofactor guanylyltransferase
MSIPKIPLTTVILAGGQGTRIGGDKGLQSLQGRALISWVVDAVKRDSEEILISANGQQAAYAEFGYRVIADQMPDWPGPLAGLEAALSVAQTQYVLSVPCDTPFLPEDLILRLLDSLMADAAEASVAVVAGRRQPAIALYNKNVLPRLRDYLGAGRRKVNDWLDSLQLSEVVFDNEREFDNINTREELLRANQLDIK